MQLRRGRTSPEKIFSKPSFPFPPLLFLFPPFSVARLRGLGRTKSGWKWLWSGFSPRFVPFSSPPLFLSFSFPFSFLGWPGNFCSSGWDRFEGTVGSGCLFFFILKKLEDRTRVDQIALFQSASCQCFLPLFSSFFSLSFLSPLPPLSEQRADADGKTNGISGKPDIVPQICRRCLISLVLVLPFPFLYFPFVFLPPFPLFRGLRGDRLCKGQGRGQVSAICFGRAALFPSSSSLSLPSFFFPFFFPRRTA